MLLNNYILGWSGSAMVLGKLPVLGRPTHLDWSRARAYCACSRCGWGLFGHFFSRQSFLFSFSLSLWETARYRLKTCLKGPLSPKQPTNQLNNYISILSFLVNRSMLVSAELPVMTLTIDLRSPQLSLSRLGRNPMPI